jgi:hypothetical protein
MALARRTIRDWLLLVIMNLSVPVMITWEYHSGQATRNVAYMCAGVSLLMLNILLVVTIRIRDKKSGNAMPGGYLPAAAGLALLSAMATLVGLHFVSSP